MSIYQASLRALVVILAVTLGQALLTGSGVRAQQGTTPPGGTAIPPGDATGTEPKNAGPCGPLKVPGYKALRTMITPAGSIESTVFSSGSRERVEAPGRPTELVDFRAGSLYLLIPEKKIAIKVAMPPVPAPKENDPNVRIERKVVAEHTQVSFFHRDPKTKQDVLLHEVICRNDGIYLEFRSMILTTSGKPFLLRRSQSAIEIITVEAGRFEVPQDYKIESSPHPTR